MKESNIEKYLRKQLKKIGGTSRKWVSPGRNGVPDQICFHNNTIFFVETKFHKHGGLSKVQEREQKHLKKQGAVIYNLPSFHAVDLLILSLFKGNPSNA